MASFSAFSENLSQTYPWKCTHKVVQISCQKRFQKSDGKNSAQLKIVISDNKFCSL